MAAVGRRRAHLAGAETGASASILRQTLFDVNRLDGIGQTDGLYSHDSVEIALT
jgi:hypothetical protein